MQEIDKEKFIKDIKKDLGIQERKKIEYKSEPFDENFGSLEEIFNNFFGPGSSKDKIDDFNNPNNVTMEYKVDTETAKTKHKTTFKYRINNNGVNEKRKIELKIPAHIRTGQIILVRGGGNRTGDSLGNLIIKVCIKH